MTREQAPKSIIFALFGTRAPRIHRLGCFQNGLVEPEHSTSFGWKFKMDHLSIFVMLQKASSMQQTALRVTAASTIFWNS